MRELTTSLLVEGVKHFLHPSDSIKINNIVKYIHFNGGNKQLILTFLKIDYLLKFLE